MQNLGVQTKSIVVFSEVAYRMLSRDVTAAMLVFLNNGTAAMLVYPTNPPGIDFYFLLFRWYNKVTDHVSENTPHTFA